MQHSMRGTALFSPGGGGALQLSPVHESSTCSILDASDLSFDATQGSVLGGPDESKLRSAAAARRLCSCCSPGPGARSRGSPRAAARRWRRRGRTSEGGGARASLWRLWLPGGEAPSRP